jgi:hypothetical protein
VAVPLLCDFLHRSLDMLAAIVPHDTISLTIKAPINSSGPFSAYNLIFLPGLDQKLQGNGTFIMSPLVRKFLHFVVADQVCCVGPLKGSHIRFGIENKTSLSLNRSFP